jgi:hypothetical protein
MREGGRFKVSLLVGERFRERFSRSREKSGVDAVSNRPFNVKLTFLPYELFVFDVINQGLR